MGEHEHDVHKCAVCLLCLPHECRACIHIHHIVVDAFTGAALSQVLLVSAQHALLSRLVLQGKADSPTQARFARLTFGTHASKFPGADYSQAAAEMLSDRGLATLEERVLGFLYTHSGNVKLLALLDDVLRRLRQV